MVMPGSRSFLRWTCMIGLGLGAGMAFARFTGAHDA